MSSIPMHHELLAPVGTLEMCRAAVHNGADAIYVGMPHFNARGRTQDMGWEDLSEIISFCRQHGVRVFLAFNILIFENELGELVPAIRQALALGPDAFIVQDLGLARLLKVISPDAVVHASTQMTVTNHLAIELVEDLDIRRFVLGREVSIPEMTEIRKHTRRELEVFVHGALCVAYSGQCLTSESFGGRSANRGQCAQSCRLEYDLIVDGEKRELGALSHLVSPKDLCGLEDIPRLMAAGIESFKIEGRLKSPEYVAATTKHYRHAMERGAPAPGALQELKKTYARDFFNGWLDGVDHQRLVDARFSSHRGLRLGRIIEVERDAVCIESHEPLSPGDGLLFADYDRDKEVGSRIYSAQEIRSGVWRLAFARDFDLTTLSAGMETYLNDSPRHDRELQRSWKDKEEWKRIPIIMRVSGEAASPLSLELRDPQGRMARVESTEFLETARSRGLDQESLFSELSALASSPFQLDRLEVQLPPGVFLRNQIIRRLRQEGVAELMRLRQGRSPRICEEDEVRAWLLSQEQEPSAPATSAVLNVLVREREQVEWLEGLPVDTVYLDFEFGKDYRPSVAKLREMGFRAGVATTRILKPNEYHNLKVIESIRPDAVLVRNLGALQWLTGKGLTLVGDFSLNAANSLSAQYLLSKGLDRLCPSYDLNQDQLLDLLGRLPGRKLEITVHQYMPSFHMEHCVFAAFLSKGSSFRDCGKPCEHHRVQLRDHTGAIHPLKADQECRNTMFNGKPQSAARLIPALRSRGVETFRLEALYEDKAALRAKVEAYASLLRGEATPAKVFADLGVVEKYGVSEGQLRNGREWRDRKK